MKIFVYLLAAALTLQAGLVNAVAIVVGDKPITLYDIDKAKQNYKLSDNEAAEMLVQEKLEEMESERLGIEVSDFEVDRELENMAAQNGLSMTQFQMMVENSGVDYLEYKQEFAEKLRKKRLFDRLANIKLSNPTASALKVYYQNHKEQFSTFERATVTKYLAQDKQVIESYIRDPFSSDAGIMKSKETISAQELNANLQYLLQNTPEGKFTPVIDVGEGYLSFFVNDKIGSSILPYEQVRNQVMQAWKKDKREEAIKLHFQKLRSQKNIEIIR